ncbi:MAG: hypothetical protein CSA11_07030 [Chloroflexi bacterium]|nr:MAG: hypothetical protein CSB13_06130 [Chloroflexota bacterium]PIE80670.1 MAG: hypothetical protein CSA11_07030 [Chloroflexota bacterium]
MTVGSSGLRSTLVGSPCSSLLVTTMGAESANDENATDVPYIGSARLRSDYSPDWDTGQTAQTPI